MSDKSKSKTTPAKARDKVIAHPGAAKSGQGNPAGDWKALLRRIPSVEEVLNRPAIRELAEGRGRRFVTERVRGVLAALRQEIQEGRALFKLASELEDRLEANLDRSIQEAVDRETSFSLRPVINATGVILHTNLGRAPLAREAMEHLIEVACQYSNLEYDIDAARRGERDVHISRQLEELLGAPAIAVNNNAAAVLLTLNTLGEGGEVIVSRGELIEIGGSFRIPDIMQRSGAVLREVGTTNRTRIGDYAAAVNERTKLLLRVHPSNFRVVGFTERPSLEELVGLGKKTGLPVYEDLGSGCLIAPRWEAAGRNLSLDEAPVAESLQAGVDVVSFSGDKLLGGPQAGLIAGKKELVARIRRNPLFRALRVDKLTYAVLETTFQAYRQGQLDRIPAWRMIRMSIPEIERRAEKLMESCAGRTGELTMRLVDGDSVVGGGSAPGQTIPTRLISLRHSRLSAAAMEKRLHAMRPPVIARTESDAVLLDLRTVQPEQDGILAQALTALSGGSPKA